MSQPSAAAGITASADSHHVGELKRAISPAMLILFVVGDIWAPASTLGWAPSAARSGERSGPRFSWASGSRR